MIPQSDAGQTGPFVNQRIIEQIAFGTGGHEREPVAEEKICFGAHLRAISELYYNLFSNVRQIKIPGQKSAGYPLATDNISPHCLWRQNRVESNWVGWA